MLHEGIERIINEYIYISSNNQTNIDKSYLWDIQILVGIVISNLYLFFVVLNSITRSGLIFYIDYLIEHHYNQWNSLPLRN